MATMAKTGNAQTGSVSGRKVDMMHAEACSTLAAGCTWSSDGPKVIGELDEQMQAIG